VAWLHAVDAEFSTYEGSLQSALDKLGFKASDGSTASTDTSELQ
jgi:hypothetical protein